MGNWNKFSKEDLERLSADYKIDLPIIQGVIILLEDYLQIYYESFKEFRLRSEPNNQAPIWLGTIEELAMLSILYHDYFSNGKLNLYNEVNFKHSTLKGGSLRFKESLANDIIKTYLLKMKEAKFLLEKERSIEILNFSKKRGKRPTEYFLKRNEIIKLAAHVLKKGSGNNNYPVLIEILNQMGYKGVTINNIKKILSISK